jgi:hypothetical protein
MEMMRVPSSRGAWAMTTKRPVQQAQGDKPLFPVREAIVFESDARSGKHLLGILETEAMLGEVLPLLKLVPFVFHPCSFQFQAML